MQEEVEMRTVTMAFHASKFSGRVMKNGIAKLLHAMHGKLTVPHGKQSVRQLARQNQGMTNIEIDDPEWQEAMKAITESLQVLDSRVYVRAYERDPSGAYQPISLDFANV